jgi:hypothetical protein
MKKYFIGFLIGFIIASVATGLLSMNASRIYLKNIRAKYSFEQEMLAVRAQKRGDLNEAFVHYSNLLYATSSPGIEFFETKPKWEFLFPIAALIIQEMERSADIPKGEKNLEAINRVKLGLILEELGRKDEAQQQYQMAANLAGVKDARELKEKVRYVQEKSMQSWDQLSK